MGEPSGYIVAGDGPDSETHRLLKRFLGAGTQATYEGLELGESLLDGRAVGGIGR